MISIEWQRKTMSQYVEQFLEQYKKHKTEQNYFLGFSYGAMICFIVSAQVPVDTQILCSLSPFFAEDITKMKKSWVKEIGKKRTEDFKQIDAQQIITNIKARTIFLRGEKELKEVAESSNRIYPNLHCSKELYIVANAKHDIGDQNYQKKIEEVIASLQ